MMKPSLRKGQLIKWNDDRGFGFIKPSNGGKEVFLHISGVKTTGRRPKVGDTIFYELSHGADGKIRASGASIEGVISQSSTQRGQSIPVKRKIKRGGILGALLSLGVAVTVGLFRIELNPSRSPTPITSITKPGCVIKGNISLNTGNKLYHVPGMEDYEGTVIDPEKGERWFCSEAEAIAAGWQKAPN